MKNTRLELRSKLDIVFGDTISGQGYKCCFHLAPLHKTLDLMPQLHKSYKLTKYILYWAVGMSFFTNNAMLMLCLILLRKFTNDGAHSYLTI